MLKFKTFSPATTDVVGQNWANSFDMAVNLWLEKNPGIELEHIDCNLTKDNDLVICVFYRTPTDEGQEAVESVSGDEQT